MKRCRHWALLWGLGFSCGRFGQSLEVLGNGVDITPHRYPQPPPVQTTIIATPSPIMGKSSKDKRDSYYRLAKESGYRARSAYKLLQLDEHFKLLTFPPSSRPRVIDLCAAPGSWSQVLARALPPESTIIALDLQPMTPITGVITLQADITHPSTLPLVFRHLNPSSLHPAGGGGGGGDEEKADLVICDGAPDVTGLHDLDEYVQASLLFSALNLAVCVLRPGGNFVAKIFRGRDVDVLFAQLRCLFERVTCAKPRSSRGSSIEAFVVCEGYAPPVGFEPSLEKPLGYEVGVSGGRMPEGMERGAQPDVVVDGVEAVEVGEEEEVWGGEVRWVAPFVACGDLSAFDSDATYRLPEVDEDGRKRESKDPVQPPTAPPYKRAVELRKQLGGGGR
jgi:tRNA (cytidine32/guanosine34-2'-O)-methyltransferase